jgi:hypothetical protein
MGRNSVKIERCCGFCCHFKHEDTFGIGLCKEGKPMYCGDECDCGDFVSVEEKRHNMAVLRQCQRCLKAADNKDMDVVSITRAIDFIVDYSKLY